MRFIALLIVILNFAACTQPSPNTIIVGTISGPETSLLEIARDVAAKKYNITVKIVEFTDYNLPNEALADGSIDANVYQHLPYLQTAMQMHGYPFEIIGKTFVYPMGIYSQQITSLNQIKEHSQIAIPNDPSNETRALMLLQQAGIITLNDGNTATLADIATNPKQLQFKELDAAQLPRVLPDVALALINTTYALPAGLNPLRDALYRENEDSAYANLVVINKNSKKKAQLKLLVKALNSPEVNEAAKRLFGDSAIPAW